MSASWAEELEANLNHAWIKYQQGDNNAIAIIYDQVMPFCFRVASKTCGRFINEDDEESSIIRLALLEVFEKYQPDRGSFILFLGRVVRNRIIDFKRSESRHFLNISLSFFDRSIANAYKSDFIENIIDDFARKQELEEFKKQLERYDINLNEVLKASPRQKKSRQRAKEISWLIVQDNDLKNHFLSKNSLSIKVMEQRYGVDRKFVDRHRKYIVANVLILINDYSYLKPYVIPDGR